MSEYIPKYPSKEGDDSNKTSSELLAETLKPIYVPQDLMLAWESHLASYSRDTHVLLDQVKDSELALNTQYQSLLGRVQKYEQMLQDITMDSNEFTMDTDEVNFTGWNILAQASYWDYLLRKEITKLSDQIKSAEYKGALVADVSDSVLESLSTGNQHISNIIGAVTNSSLIRDLDAALSGTSSGLSALRLEHEKLKAKQYADALALADQNGESFDALSLTFNNLISEQIDRIADEAATRTRVFEGLEDGLTVESQLRQEGQEVIATQVFALKASTETSLAGIKKEYSTIAGTDEAITTALTTYTAKVEGTIANITTDYVSYAKLDSALVSKSEELLAIVNNNISKLNITNEINAGLSSVKAVSTVTVDLNGVVTGYGLISELENGIVKSAFGVNADTFYVGKPTDAVKPFVVSSVPTTIDGIDFPAGTWINSAIIANATIGSAHIKDASITNAKIKELDASKITTGVLNANRIRVGPTSTFDDGYNPASKARTFVTQPTVPYSVGDIWKNGTSTYICKTHRVAGSFTASEWEKVGDVTSENTALDVVNVNGVSAATVATNAATGKTLSDNIMSDLIITPVEKSGLLNEWNRIKAEYTNIVTQGTATGVSTATLTTNYNALNGSVPRIELDILASMTTHYIMTAANRDAFKAKLKLYFDTAEATAKDITNKVNDIAASKAMTYLTQPITPYTAGDIWKSGTSTYICITGRTSGAFIAGDWVKVGDVTSENTAANANQLGGTAASTVLDNAAKGLTVYNDVMSDLKITPVEKTALNTEWARIKAEYSSVLAHAESMAVSTTAFTSAYNALNSTSPTMTSILSSMTTTTTLTAAQRDALRTQFANYYAQVTAVVKAISDKVADNAKAYTDAIEVGAANLLYRSYDSSLWITYGSPTFSLTSDNYVMQDSVLVTQTTFEGSGGTNTLKAYRQASNLEMGKTLTMSAYVKNRGTKNLTVNTLGLNPSSSLTVAPGNIERIVFTGTLTSSAQFRIETAAAADSFKVDIIDLKYEYGNKATSWTPSPAEVNALIDSKAKTFLTTPTVPYGAGDIWKDGATTKVALVFRGTGTFTASDWALAGDVTADNTSKDTAAVGGMSAVTVRDNAAKGLKVHDDVMSDLIITPVEKTFLNTEWNRIKAEYTNLYNQAIALNIPTVDFSAAYTALDGTTPRISSEVLASMITNYTLTTTTRDALRAKLNTYFNKAVDMSVIITTKINTLAAAAKDTADQAILDAQNKSAAAELAAKAYATAQAEAERLAAIAAASNDATSKANAAESAAKAAAALDAKNKADAAKQAAIAAAALDATAKADAAKAAAKVLSDAAQKAADDARLVADNATLELSDISSDEKLTPNEKQQVKLIWDEIDRTHTELVKQAGVYSLSTTAYLTKYNALSAYISPLLSSMSTTSNVVRVTFQANFADYYSARAVLGNAISTSAKNLADAKSVTFTAQPTIPYSKGDLWKDGTTIKVSTVTRTSGSYTAADWVLVGDVTANNTSADTAKVNGVNAATVVLNAANGAAVYADVMSDLKITPVEKTAINQEWNRIQQEYASLLAQAQAISLTTTPYTSAYTGLSTTAPAMSTILASMSTTTTLTAAERDAYKSQYTTYYIQAVAITKAINDKIAANAKAQADAKSKTFTAQPVTPYTAGDLWKDGATIKVCTVTRASGSYTAADWILVGDVTSANTSANSNQLGGTPAATINTNINNADIKAGQAQATANAANNQVNAWKFTGTTKIDGGNIQADTITAAQISVNELSAISADLGTIQVGTANIAEGAISTAKIGDLQVDTIKVKDNAVTNGIASQNTTSLTIVTEGGPVRINVGITHYARSKSYKFTNTLILYRDGIELKRWTFTGYWNSVDYVWEILLNQELPMLVDIVGAGTHTYSLSGLGTTSMALLEVKK